MLSREYTGPLGDNGASPGARWLLADRVSRALSDARLESLTDPVERIVRLAVPAGRVNPFRWLSEQRMFPKVYWSGREDRAGVAAVGIADLREAGVALSERASMKSLTMKSRFEKVSSEKVKPRPAPLVEDWYESVEALSALGRDMVECYRGCMGWMCSQTTPVPRPKKVTHASLHEAQ